MEEALASKAKSFRNKSVLAKLGRAPTVQELPPGTNVPEPDRVGWMQKRSQGKSLIGRVNWKNRWFTLHQDSLRYYDGAGVDAVLKGTVPLSRVLAVEPSHDFGGRQFLFQIVHTSVLYCQAKDESDRSAWLSSIRRHAAQNNIMHLVYHPGLYINKQYSCCQHPYKESTGCTPAYNYSSIKSSFRRRLSSRISSQKQDPSDSDKSTKAVVPSEDLPLPALPSLQPAKEAARPPEAESAGVLDLNLKPGVPVVVAAAGKDVQLNAEDLQKQPQTRGSERHDYAATADTIATDAAGGNVSGADAIDDLIATTSYSPPPGSTGMLSFSQGDQIRVVKREAGGWLAAVMGTQMGWVPESYFAPVSNVNVDIANGAGNEAASLEVTAGLPEEEPMEAEDSDGGEEEAPTIGPTRFAFLDEAPPPPPSDDSSLDEESEYETSSDDEGEAAGGIHDVERSDTTAFFERARKESAAKRAADAVPNMKVGGQYQPMKADATSSYDEADAAAAAERTKADADAVERAKSEAEAVERARVEAEAAERAKAEVEAAERAKAESEAADAVERAKSEAEAVERARVEAEAAERAKAKVEAAERAKAEAEAAERAKAEAEAAERARIEDESTERAKAEAEATERAKAEAEAAERAKAEADAAERARVEAEVAERAKAEAEAAAAAERAKAEADARDSAASAAAYCHDQEQIMMVRRLEADRAAANVAATSLVVERAKEDESRALSEVERATKLQAKLAKEVDVTRDAAASASSRASALRHAQEKVGTAVESVEAAKCGYQEAVRAAEAITRDFQELRKAQKRREAQADKDELARRAVEEAAANKAFAAAAQDQAAAASAKIAANKAKQEQKAAAALAAKSGPPYDGKGALELKRICKERGLDSSKADEFKAAGRSQVKLMAILEADDAACGRKASTELSPEEKATEEELAEAERLAAEKAKADAAAARVDAEAKAKATAAAAATAARAEAAAAARKDQEELAVATAAKDAADAAVKDAMGVADRAQDAVAAAKAAVTLAAAGSSPEKILANADLASAAASAAAAEAESAKLALKAACDARERYGRSTGSAEAEAAQAVATAAAARVAMEEQEMTMATAEKALSDAEAVAATFK